MNITTSNPNKIIRNIKIKQRTPLIFKAKSNTYKNDTQGASVDLYNKKSAIDLFAGSGSLGIEAISRGISKVFFYENNSKVLDPNFWKDKVDTVSFVKVQNRWDTYNNKPDGEISPCMYLWERMYVWFDGTTNPCDVDYKSELSMGKLDYSVNSIRELWNSNLFQSLRHKHLNNQRQSIVPCDRCGLSF